MKIYSKVNKRNTGPGIKGEVFKLTLSKDWPGTYTSGYFGKDDISYWEDILNQKEINIYDSSTTTRTSSYIGTVGGSN